MTDGTGRLRATWFNQDFRERQLQPGAEVALSGKIEWSPGEPADEEPDVDVLGRQGEPGHRADRPHPPVGSAGEPGTPAAGDIRSPERGETDLGPGPRGDTRRAGLMDRDTAFAAIHFPEVARPGGVEPAPARLRRVVPARGGAGGAAAPSAQTSKGIVHDAGRALQPGTSSTTFPSGSPGPRCGRWRRSSRPRLGRPDAPPAPGRGGVWEDGGGRRHPARRCRGGLPGCGDGSHRGARRAALPQHHRFARSCRHERPRSRAKEVRLGMDSLFAGPPGEAALARRWVALLTGSSAEVTSRPRAEYAAGNCST